ncbi:MAG: hypothetical protein ABI207_04130, partial [Crocinitomicaceae bacterium]
MVEGMETSQSTTTSTSTASTAGTKKQSSPKKRLENQIIDITNQFFNPDLFEQRNGTLKALIALLEKNKAELSLLQTSHKKLYVPLVEEIKRYGNVDAHHERVVATINSLRSTVSEMEPRLAYEQLKMLMVNPFFLKSPENLSYIKKVLTNLEDDNNKALIKILELNLFSSSPYKHQNIPAAKILIQLISQNNYFNLSQHSLDYIIKSSATGIKKQKELVKIYEKLLWIKTIIIQDAYTISRLTPLLVNIKKTYASLAKNTDDQHFIRDNPSQPNQIYLPSLSTQEFYALYNELRSAVILSTEDMMELSLNMKMELLQKALKYFKSTIDSFVVNPDSSSQEKHKLLQCLDTIGAFIYRYHYNTHAGNTIYKSYYCWVISLIQKTIAINNKITNALATDWQDQLEKMVRKIKDQIVGSSQEKNDFSLFRDASSIV